MLSAPGNGAKLPQGSMASTGTVARALSGCMQSTDKLDTQVPWDTAQGQARHCFLCRGTPGATQASPAQQETPLPATEPSPATTSCTVARISPCGLLEAMHV